MAFYNVHRLQEQMLMEDDFIKDTENILKATILYSVLYIYQGMSPIEFLICIGS